MKRRLMGMVALCFAATFPSAAQDGKEARESGSDHAWSPVAISILPSVQWPREDADITGLWLNLLVGQYHNFYGVDVATWGNKVSNCTAGIQLAGLGNLSDTVYGFQLAALGTAGKDLSGVQIGAINAARKDLTGFQIGAGNLAGDLTGFQIGALNGADKLSGVQIGVFNYAGKANGLQVGVLNYISDATCSCLPLLNMQF